MNVNIQAVINALAHRNLHKLAGTALAVAGVVTGLNTTTGWREITIGSAYAAIMHLVGGIKKLPD